MPYTLFKSNGSQLTTVNDGTLNLTTDLKFVGKNYAGYGQVVNENLLKILENFSNSEAPSKPLVGQLWYDTANKKLKIYNGLQWNICLTASNSSEVPEDLSEGDLWFDRLAQVLYVKSNGKLLQIGPNKNENGTGGVGFTESEVLSDTDTVYKIIKLTIAGDTVAVVSKNEFIIDSTHPLSREFSKIKKGITLRGADSTTGISSSEGFYYWGTAADALKLNGVDASEYLLSSQVSLIATNITALGNINRISTGSPSTPGTIEGDWNLTSGSQLRATYADLAERYHADAEYDMGTVLIIGGEAEVTLTTVRADIRVAGIVSVNPAYLMNHADHKDSLHPAIALKGRIPCKVFGRINKGDLLVSSSHKGYAEVFRPGDSESSVIGKALTEQLDGFGLVEVKV